MTWSRALDIMPGRKSTSRRYDEASDTINTHSQAILPVLRSTVKRPRRSTDVSVWPGHTCDRTNALPQATTEQRLRLEPDPEWRRCSERGVGDQLFAVPPRRVRSAGRNGPRVAGNAISSGGRGDCPLIPGEGVFDTRLALVAVVVGAGLPVLLGFVVAGLPRPRSVGCVVARRGHLNVVLVGIDQDGR